MIARKLKEIAEKYLSGTATEEEKKKLHDWYDLAQDDMESKLSVMSEDTREQVKQRIFRKLQSHTGHDGGNRKTGYIRKYRLQGLAASVILLFAIWVGINTIFSNGTGKWLTVEVAPGEVKELLLPDSSVVWINSGSVFRYPAQFGRRERRVELPNGQAFFEVRRDESKSFLVNAGKLEVLVSGTSFDVKSYTSESLAKVSVLTGAVNVGYGSARDDHSLKLLPGEQAVINRQEKSLRTETLDKSLIAAWREGRLAFENEQVEYVLKALERRYGIDITVPSQKLLKEFISIKLEDEPLENVLEVLKYTLDFNYEIIDGKTIKISE